MYYSQTKSQARHRSRTFNIQTMFPLSHKGMQSRMGLEVGSPVHLSPLPYLFTDIKTPPSIQQACQALAGLGVDGLVDATLQYVEMGSTSFNHKINRCGVLEGWQAARANRG